MLQEAERTEEEDRPSPWIRARLDVLGVAFVIAVLVVVHSPVLFFGHTYSTDSYFYGSNGALPYPGQQTTGFDTERTDLAASNYQFEPWSQVVSESYHSGSLPLWTPYQGFGAPLAANGQSSAFDPMMAIVFAHPSQWTWDLTFFGTFLLSALATYALLRVLGVRQAGAAAAGILFGLSGYFFLNSNNNFVRNYAYLPILALALEWVLRSRRLLAVAALAAATAGCFLVGMPEAAFLILGFAVGYALLRVWFAPGESSRLWTIVRIGAGMAAGGLLAAPLLLPFAQYEGIALTYHQAGMGVGERHDPLSAAMTWVAPFFDGHDLHEGWSGSPLSLRNWVGGSAVALALVSLASTQRKRILASLTFLVPAALMLAKVYGLPIISLVGKLPLAERVNFPGFGTPVAAFGIAVAAGFGVDAIARRAVDRRRLLVIGGVAVAAGLVWVLSNWTFLQTIGRSRYLPPVLAAVVAMALVAAAAAWSRWRWAAYVAVGVVAIEAIALFPTDNLAVRADPYVPPIWLTAASADMAQHPHDRTFGFEALLMPNIATAFDLSDIRSIDALFPERYFRYIQTFVEPQVQSRFEGTTATAAEETTPLNYAGNPMFDLLGVRFLFSRSVREAPGLKELIPSDGVHVYVSEAAMPRAFVVHDVMAVANEDEAIAAMSAGGGRFDDGAVKATAFDPRFSAVVETDDGAPFPSETCAPTGDSVEIEDYDVTSVRLRVTAGCAGLAVLTDTYFPGWQATVNGHDEEIVPTDLAFRGVAVPAGTSIVELRFRPSTFRAGVLVAGATVVGFVVLGAVQWLLRSRRRKAASP